MEDAYQDYGFYMSSIPRSLFAGAIVALIIGLIVSLNNNQML